MSSGINEDLAEMKKKLTEYINKGRIVGFREVRDEPVMTVKPDKSKIKPLTKMKNYEGNFLAVDCSTRTLKRANNWGVYLMRVAYASVKGKDVDWGYEERMCTVVGDSFARRGLLQDGRVELESQMALDVLCKSDRVHYLFLDGPSFFGGMRKFRTFLYERCEASGINLLAISKQSPTLHDEGGRDLVAAVYQISPYSLWVYHPVVKADKERNLYGDVSILKLCPDSPRIFRCDIMEYLTDREIEELLSPLTCISEDPRSLGYPVALWLAHDFSTPSNSMLLHFHDIVEQTLAEAGVLDVLRIEELSCNFPDELHGVRHAFEWELIERV
ncbi:MAG: DNA double-strand break repair nuclease NurA [Candidatus Bathyarchaeia archaeon]